MYSQTHYCPNFLLHPTALIHFDGAALRPVFPLQSGSNSSSPSLSAMAHTPRFHLHYLGSALPIYLPPPPLYLVYSHWSSLLIIGTGLLKHGSYAIPLLKTIHGSPTSTVHSPGSSAWLSTSALTTVQSITCVYTKPRPGSSTVVPAHWCTLSL